MKAMNFMKSKEPAGAGQQRSKGRIFREIRSYLLITLGSVITAGGINLFLVPNRISGGGVTGLASVLHHLFSVPVGTAGLVLNIPLFALAVYQLGRSFGVKTLYAIVLLAAVIDGTAFLPRLTGDLLLAALFGGITTGLGLGVVFRQNATTGGTDLAARLLHHSLPFLTIGQWLFAADMAVVCLAAVTFGDYELGLYAAVTLFAGTWTIDTVILGVNYTKAVYIISDCPDVLAGRLLQLPRGVTALKGKGMFTGIDKDVLLCVLRKREIMTLRRIVEEVDPQAFIFITEAREVFGEGFAEKS